MSHLAQLEFIVKVQQAFPEVFTRKKVLEVGSLDINGSVRSHFQDCEYLGLDIGPGAGVDIVCPGQSYEAPDESFDVTISCECMEHNPFWKETFLNMVRMTKAGGTVIMSCATTGRDEHGTARSNPEWSPLTVDQGWNYYRNLTADDFYKEIDIEKIFQAHVFIFDVRSSDLYFMGFRPGSSRVAEIAKKLASFRTAYDKLNRASPRKLLRYTLMNTFGESRMRTVMRYMRSAVGRSNASDRIYRGS